MLLQYFVKVDIDEVIQDMMDILEEPDMLEKLAGDGLSKEDLFRSWNFRPVGANSIALRTARINAIRLFIRDMMAIPGAIDWIKLQEFVRTYMQQAMVFNADDFIRTEQEFNIHKQQIAQEAQIRAQQDLAMQTQAKVAEEAGKAQAKEQAKANSIASLFE